MERQPGKTYCGDGVVFGVRPAHVHEVEQNLQAHYVNVTTGNKRVGKASIFRRSENIST
jgi:hypothetical protein